MLWEKQRRQNVSLTVVSLKAWPLLTAISLIVLKHSMLIYITGRWRSEQVKTCHFTQKAYRQDTCHCVKDYSSVTVQVEQKWPCERCKSLSSVLAFEWHFMLRMKTLHTVHEILFCTDASVMVHFISVGKAVAW